MRSSVAKDWKIFRKSISFHFSCIASILLIPFSMTEQLNWAKDTLKSDSKLMMKNTRIFARNNSHLDLREVSHQLFCREHIQLCKRSIQIDEARDIGEHGHLFHLLSRLSSIAKFLPSYIEPKLQELKRPICSSNTRLEPTRNCQMSQEVTFRSLG